MSINDPQPGDNLMNCLSGASLVVVSDIHLKRPDDERGMLLQQVLEGVAVTRPECFVLLGDIFDFCLGSNLYFQTKFASLGAALSRLAKTGTRVIFFEGNHEFDVHRFGWDGVEFVREGSLVLPLGSGASILLAHGDLIYSSQVYRSFRRMVKSKLVRGIASSLPGSWVEAFALKNSEASRAYDTYRDINHAAILAAARRWLEAHQCDMGIFGHFHVPYAEGVDGSTAGILSLNSWDEPNLLLRKGDEFSRVFLSPQARPELLRSALAQAHA